MEKSILESPLGLNPLRDGQEIVVKVPSPTRETKLQMCKVARAQTEQARVRLRKARQKALQSVKKRMDDKDERKVVEKDLEKMFDEALRRLEKMSSAKEGEILS